MDINKVISFLKRSNVTFTVNLNPSKKEIKRIQKLIIESEPTRVGSVC